MRLGLDIAASVAPGRDPVALARSGSASTSSPRPTTRPAPPQATKPGRCSASSRCDQPHPGRDPRARSPLPLTGCAREDGRDPRPALGRTSHSRPRWRLRRRRTPIFRPRRSQPEREDDRTRRGGHDHPRPLGPVRFHLPRAAFTGPMRRTSNPSRSGESRSGSARSPHAHSPSPAASQTAGSPRSAT